MMGEIEEGVMDNNVWNKKWGNSSGEILDGIAFNTFSDATVCCSGKRIPVHQMVLAASSDYFREILYSSKSSHPFIIFENVNLKALEQLLMFIYRGQVFVRPQETRSLFKLAEEFKVKGLSGPIGSDLTTKHDFDPPGVDVLNLNLFRKCVGPKIRDMDVLRTKISGLIQITSRKTRISESQSMGDFKVSKVKVNKYKIVGCNRTRIYDKEDTIATLHQDPSESAREREIFDQFSNISLVEDTSKTFTEEAVKDLVTRLTSDLKIVDQNSLMEGENQELSHQGVQQAQQENEEQSQKEVQLAGPQSQATQNEAIKSIVNFAPFRFEGTSSALELSITQHSKEKIEQYVVKTTTNLPGAFLEFPPTQTTSKMCYSCDLCSFTSSHGNLYERHMKVHSLEQHKPLLERIGREKLVNRIEKLKNRAGFLEHKTKLVSYSDVSPSTSKSLMERCYNFSSSVNNAAGTSNMNNSPTFRGFFESNWDRKCPVASTIRNHFQDLYEGKRKVSSQCTLKGFTKDNTSCQRYGRRHRKYICLFCSHKTYHKKNLIEHQKIHVRKPDNKKNIIERKKPTEDMELRCRLCGKTFIREIYFKTHMSNFHSLEDNDDNNSPAT